MALDAKKCKNAKPQLKPYKMGDDKGLYLYVTPKGQKYWRMKYRYAGKEKVLSLGVYPETSLADAREACLNARKLLMNDIDPSQDKKERKAQNQRNSQNTFEAVTREWHAHKKAKWASERYADDVITRIADNLFSDIGHRLISSITPPELLACLRKIEKRGAYEIAKRCRQVAGQVFRYGIAIGVCDRDISVDLKDALASRKKVHFRALDIQTLPSFLDALDKNEARLYAQTINATHLLVLTFVRTSELINAHWNEIKFDKAEWHIPAERMKMRRPHIVPLSKQALDILRAQKLISGHRPFVFPSIVHGKKCMSNGTILGAIRRLGFKELTTGHGFRALARTTIREELDYPADVIETQLAHKSQGVLGEAYDRTQFLKKRKVMMQDWANYIDTLASQGKVIRGKFGS